MALNLVEKFEELEQKYASIEAEMSNSETISNMERYNDLNKVRHELEEPVSKFKDYKKILGDIVDAKDIVSKNEDPEFVEMAKEELGQLQPKEEQYRQELTIMLLPTDTKDTKNCYLEIRSGTGGEEAALFARDLYEMYSKYVVKQGWSSEVVDVSEADAGGFAKVILFITGNRVYSRLKYESGTHRVQRVPATEASGRIHTSAATVAIISEADEVDIKIKTEDLKIDTFRASGAGGQHINKTESAIRITHIPSGIIVACQEDRSQHKNRDRAMKLLASKLHDMEEEANQREQSEARKLQVGSGDRSEKIRTYNYPQGRVTDHRIGLTLYKLESIMQGDLDEIIDGLITAERLERLKEL